MRIFTLLDKDRHIIKELFNVSQVDGVKINNTGCHVSFKDGSSEHFLQIENNSFEYKDGDLGVKSNSDNLYVTNDNWETCKLTISKRGIYAAELVGRIIGTENIRFVNIANQ